MSQRPFKILGIEHVGVAVESMEDISSIFSDVLGLEFSGSEEVAEQQVITDIYQVDNSKLEFLKATSKDSPIARFIDKKGTGMHHIAFLVDHLQPALQCHQAHSGWWEYRVRPAPKPRTGDPVRVRLGKWHPRRSTRPTLPNLLPNLRPHHPAPHGNRPGTGPGGKIGR